MHCIVEILHIVRWGILFLATRYIRVGVIFITIIGQYHLLMGATRICSLLEVVYFKLCDSPRSLNSPHLFTMLLARSHTDNHAFLGTTIGTTIY